MSKNTHTMLAVILMAVAATACSESSITNPKASLASKMDSVSYALGFQNGQFLFEEGVQGLNQSDYLAGLMHGLSETDSKIEEADMLAIIQQFTTELREAKFATVKQEGLDFLAANKSNEGVMETESGLQYKVLEPGSGKSPAPTNTVRVHYEGTLIDGTVFDSSYNRGNPAEFVLNQVIPGWTEGLQLMKEGASYEFYIPSHLAYGERGAGNVIQPNSTLIFKVELIEVK